MIKLCFLLCLVVGSLAELEDPALEDLSQAELEEYKDFLVKSIEDDGKTLEERMTENPLSSEWENSGKFQGDILLDKDLIEDLVNVTQSRKAYIRPNTRWPGNTIVWEFAAGHFTANQRQQIHNAINDIVRNTCVRFRVRNSADRNFVRLTNHNTGCYAHVGFWNTRGVHTLNLANGCFRHATIVHEWMHIAGFFHMQSTYNRYNYVRVLWQNIRQGRAHNFYRHGNNIVSNMGLHYEYESCMHYGRYFFSHNGQPTLQNIWPDHGLMGQRNFVTATDFRRLARLYNCPGAW